jgi:hypothetical protein
MIQKNGVLPSLKNTIDLPPSTTDYLPNRTDERTQLHNYQVEVSSHG